MSHIRKFLAFLMLAVILLTFGACKANDDNPDKVPTAENDFEISVLKVGQADAIILKTANHLVVIDCGEKNDKKEVVEKIAEIGDKIDYLIITHFDKDHVGGAPKVVEKYEIEHTVVPNYKGTVEEYTKFEDALKDKGITPVRLEDKMSFTLDDVLFEVYPPMKDYYSEGDNDYSLVVSITHGSNTFLFAGDAEEERLMELTEQLDLKHDFLKMPHHGKYCSGTLLFVDSVKPTYTVITDSEKNPAEDATIAALKAVDSKVYYTRKGDITVVSNGKTITITQ